MTYSYNLEISIGNTRYCDKYLCYKDIERLAINDGFESIQQFSDWFIPLIKAHEQEHFSGKIIHWTDFKY